MIEMTPIRAAGVPPRKTIARTEARKLPEIFSRDCISIAVTSLKIEKPTDPEQAEIPVGTRRLPDRCGDRRYKGGRQDGVLRRVGRSVMDRAWSCIDVRWFLPESNSRVAECFLRLDNRLATIATLKWKVEGTTQLSNPA